MKRKGILYYSIEIAGVEDERKDALGGGIREVGKG
jgi:hypothetical protein